MPHPGGSWRPQGHPATRPHEYVRGGTCKLLTLFHPATGQVHIRPVGSCTNPVLHGWLKETLAAIVAALPVRAEPADPAAARAAWGLWQEGLTERSALPEPLPPLRLLLVWDNLAGHKSAEMVLWLCRHGTCRSNPLAALSELAESIPRILKRRTLDPHPLSPAGNRRLVQHSHRLAPPPTPFLFPSSAGNGAQASW